MSFDKGMKLVTRADDVTAQNNLAHIENRASGVRDYFISDLTLTGGTPANTSDNATKCYNELAIRKNSIFSGNFNILDSVMPSWKSGQTLRINLASRGLGAGSGNDIYVTITKVTWNFLGGNEIKYTIEFDSQVYRLHLFLIKILNQSRTPNLETETFVNI
jgi:hypothetical protein